MKTRILVKLFFQNMLPEVLITPQKYEVFGWILNKVPNIQVIMNSNHYLKVSAVGGKIQDAGLHDTSWPSQEFQQQLRVAISEISKGKTRTTN